MLVDDWPRGQSEVHMRVPDEAMDGAPDAATHRARFQQLVNDELSALFSMVANSPFGEHGEPVARADPPET